MRNFEYRVQKGILQLSSVRGIDIEYRCKLIKILGPFVGVLNNEILNQLTKPTKITHLTRCQMSKLFYNILQAIKPTRNKLQ